MNQLQDPSVITLQHGTTLDMLEDTTKDRLNKTTTTDDDGVKTPKTMGTTEAMFARYDEDGTHDLSDSFTLPGRISHSI